MRFSVRYWKCGLRYKIKVESFEVQLSGSYFCGQCRINHGAGGAPAPGPLSSGGPHNFTVIIFIHTKYTKNGDSSVLRILILFCIFKYLISTVLELSFT